MQRRDRYRPRPPGLQLLGMLYRQRDWEEDDFGRRDDERVEELPLGVKGNERVAGRADTAEGVTQNNRATVQNTVRACDALDDGQQAGAAGPNESFEVIVQRVDGKREFRLPVVQAHEYFVDGLEVVVAQQRQQLRLVRLVVCGRRRRRRVKHNGCRRRRRCGGDYRKP